MTPTTAPPVTSTGSDLAWLSWLRFFAICGVVVIHTVGYNAIEPGARETLRGTLAIYLDAGFIFAVPIFVMASGATLLDPAKYTTPGAFLRKRASRLIPPVIFWHLWYVVINIVIGRGQSFTATIAAIINGKLYTALYFFWIVLGLALVTPLVIPFIRQASRLHIVVAGSILAALPALSLATVKLRGTGIVSADMAWTWWIPYLGVYLLGWGLRGVFVTGWRVLLLAVLTLGLGVLQGYAWRNPAATVINLISPPSYYAAFSIAYTVAIYLLFQSLVRPDGALRVLARGTVARVGRALSDATLGVFGLHLTVLLVLQRLVYGNQTALPGAASMLLRTVAVVVITYVVVLLLRQVKLFRTVL